MNSTDPDAVASRPPLPSRLRSTLPSDLGPDENRSYIQKTSPSSAYESLYSGPAKSTWLELALLELSRQRWVILITALSGLVVGIFYTVEFCVPLYQVEASIEVRAKSAASRTEALAHVLTSQSLINSGLLSLPESERVMLVEPSRFKASDAGLRQRLRQRLKALPIPSAQVIDISLLTPNRIAGVNFVNQLVQKLILRNLEQRDLVDAAAEPDLRTSENIAIIDPAVSSPDAVSPNVFINSVAGTLAGALAALIFVLARHLIANPFSSPGSVNRVLGLRELGAVPERKLLAAGNEEFTTVALEGNEESLRYLRSSLLYQPGKREFRCLAFTSAAPGEGKTTVVSNLSMSLAATGRRVLVIDGDLRRPRLHKLLRVAQGPGLADLLRRDVNGPPAPLSRFVYATPVQNLYVLPPGTPGDDAPELLGGQNLVQLIREISRSFDFVLIDTPPLLACADARNFARAAEGVVLVVRSSETQKRSALAARDMMLQDGATIVGTVLTGGRQTFPTYGYQPASHL